MRVPIVIATAIASVSLSACGAPAPEIRMLMLDRDLTKAAGELASTTPQLQPLIAQWQSAPTVEEKRFAAAFLLLRRPDRKKFEAILRRFSRQWAGAKQIECTGPWPPYSFVSRGERG